MSDDLSGIAEFHNHVLIRLQVIEQILMDLLKLQIGQAEIQSHLRRQDVKLRRLLQRTRPLDYAVTMVFTVVDMAGNISEGLDHMEVKIQQKFTCSVEFQDQAGNVATVDEPPEWSVDPDGILTLEPSEDGLSVVVKSETKAGSAQVLCKADADLGEGVTEITGMLSVTVLPGDAVTVTLNPGEVEDIATVPPVQGQRRRVL